MSYSQEYCAFTSGRSAGFRPVSWPTRAELKYRTLLGHVRADIQCLARKRHLPLIRQFAHIYLLQPIAKSRIVEPVLTLAVRFEWVLGLHCQPKQGLAALGVRGVTPEKNLGLLQDDGHLRTHVDYYQTE